MGRVNTTVSSTHCSKSTLPDRAGRGLALCLVLLLWVGLMGLGRPAHAATAGEVQEMRLERDEDSLSLQAVLAFELPALAEDALRKGIPMYFVTEAEVTRSRWYWSDQRIAKAERYLRLSYQPLTRRWRLNVSSEPFDPSGLGVMVGQNFEDLPEVLAAMQRISRWKIAPASAVETGTAYQLQLRFRLDLSQLPRPLQIGALGRSGWNLSFSRGQRWVAEAAP
jgi:hypothetical protein